MRFATPVTTVSANPDPLSTTISQGLYGEQVEQRERLGHYCKVRNKRDDYEGYVLASSLEDNTEPSTHFVCTASTLLFSRPDIKAPLPVRIMFGSELVITDAQVKSLGDNTFSETDSGQFVLTDHCIPMGSSVTTDIVSAAEHLFSGVPYLWGGRSVDGFDCSGLVQMSAFAIGVLLPRDSGMQEAFLSNTVSLEDIERSDLVFWPGHVGLMLDNNLLLHATAHSMLSVVEPLIAVIERAGAVSSIKRL